MSNKILVVDDDPADRKILTSLLQKTGEIIKNPNLEADGMAEKNAGKVQNVIGKIEKAVGA